MLPLRKSPSTTRTLNEASDGKTQREVQNRDRLAFLRRRADYQQTPEGLCRLLLHDLGAQPSVVFCHHRIRRIRDQAGAWVERNLDLRRK